jgi:hypothetical protein
METAGAAVCKELRHTMPWEILLAGGAATDASILLQHAKV